VPPVSRSPIKLDPKNISFQVNASIYRQIMLIKLVSSKLIHVMRIMYQDWVKNTKIVNKFIKNRKLLVQAGLVIMNTLLLFSLIHFFYPNQIKQSLRKRSLRA